MPSRSSTARRDVPDVEVQRVAVEQQEERRHEHQDHQRAPVAADLPQLLAARRRAPAVIRPAAAALLDDVEEDVLERRSDVSADRVTSTSARPQPRGSDLPEVGRGLAQHGVDGGAEQARLLDLGHLVERAHQRRRAGRRAARRSAGRRRCASPPWSFRSPRGGRRESARRGGSAPLRRDSASSPAR